MKLVPFFLLAGALALSGCVHPSEIGREPVLSPVGAGIGVDQMAVKPSVYPATSAGQRYSTWDDRAAGLFTANRAMSRGDIVTVKIKINDRAEFDNKSDRSRTSGKSLGLGGSYNLSTGAGGSADYKGKIDSTTDFAGSGATTRRESIDLSIAAVVVNILESGNLIIQGSQEVRVNAELRVLTLSGIVRPSDIGPNNTIDYARIAEARISYGGAGRITEVQQPTYGQQILDNYLPF